MQLARSPVLLFYVVTLVAALATPAIAQGEGVLAARMVQIFERAV